MAHIMVIHLAMALGERNIFNENFDLMFPVRRVPWPSTWMNDEEVKIKKIRRFKN